MKPNKNRTCEDGTYCIINQTKLLQIGDGRKLQCPVCGALYDPEWTPPPTQEEKEEAYRKMINRKYGWPT